MRTLVSGHGLREIREHLHLTLKAVETLSRRIAAERHNHQYLFTAGRLSQIENSNSLPSIYKLATLSRIYHVPYLELLQLFEVDAGDEHPLTLDLGKSVDDELLESSPGPRRC